MIKLQEYAFDGLSSLCLRNLVLVQCSSTNDVLSLTLDKLGPLPRRTLLSPSHHSRSSQ